MATTTQPDPFIEVSESHGDGGPGGDSFETPPGLDLYESNPFCLLSLPVSAGEREIRRGIRQRKAMITAAGGDAETAEAEGNELLRQLRAPEQRFFYEFFWFWDMDDSPRRAGGIGTLLLERDYYPLMKIWRAMADRPADAPAKLHDMAVLTHALALSLENRPRVDSGRPPVPDVFGHFYWKQSYELWRECANREDLWQLLRERVRSLSDPRLTTGLVRRFRERLPQLVMGVNARIGLRRAAAGQSAEAEAHFQRIRESRFPAGAVEEVYAVAARPLFERLEFERAALERRAAEAPSEACAAVDGFLEKTGAALSRIRALLPPGHPRRSAAADLAAEAVLDGLIAASPERSSFPRVIASLERALEAAESPQLRAKIQENIQLLRENLEYPSCWFCEDYLARGEDNLVLDAPVAAGRRGIEVPRCRRCREAHSRVRRMSASGAALGGVFGLMTSIAFLPLAGAGMLGAAAAIASAAGFMGRAAARNRALRDSPAGIKPEGMARAGFVDGTGETGRWAADGAKPVSLAAGDGA